MTVSPWARLALVVAQLRQMEVDLRQAEPGGGGGAGRFSSRDERVSDLRVALQIAQAELSMAQGTPSDPRP
jgi:hypothetical protein